MKPGASIVSAAVLATAAFAASGALGQEPPYTVRDGRVDKATYTGLQVFQARCASCHGAAAAGTQNAPNLLPRVAAMSPAQFVGVVLNRSKLVMPKGETGPEGSGLRDAWIAEVMSRQQGELIMPEWSGDPAVKPHVLDIYAHLRARADGVLDAKPPKP